MVAVQLCPLASVAQLLEGTLYTPTPCTVTLFTLSGPLLVTVIGTSGMYE